MIVAGFFQSVDFFVMAAVVAAAIIAYMCLPKKHGEARTYTIAGNLGNIGTSEIPATAASASDHEAGWLLVECRDDGSVVFTRTGISGITTSGAVSAAAVVTGLDLVIQERRSPGYSSDPECTSASFLFDFLAPDWYHVRYENSDLGEFCSFQFHVKPGVKLRRRIKQ